MQHIEHGRTYITRIPKRRYALESVSKQLNLSIKSPQIFRLSKKSILSIGVYVQNFQFQTTHARNIDTKLPYNYILSMTSTKGVSNAYVLQP